MTNEREQLLMVDDDQQFCRIVKDYLTKHDFDIEVVYDGDSMTRYLSEHHVDLIILDVMLPGEDGLSLARRLQAEKPQQAFIMLSAAGDEADRIVGLEMGSDDYLTKPISLRELLARIRAVLRRLRYKGNSQSSSTIPLTQNHIYTFGPFILDSNRHVLTKEEKEINLTTSEYNLLFVFVTHPERVLSRDRLMNLIKGYDHTPYDRSIDVTVRRLRTKIEPDPSTPAYIRTIRGEGYLFSPQGRVK